MSREKHSKAEKVVPLTLAASSGAALGRGKNKARGTREGGKSPPPMSPLATPAQTQNSSTSPAAPTPLSSTPPLAGASPLKSYGLLRIARKGEEAKTSYSQFVWPSDSLIIDAEPHIMALARKLFDHGKSVLVAGKFTHKILSMPLNNSNCKDALWFCSRYPLQIADEVMAEMQAKADDYDRAVAAVATASDDKESHFSPLAAVMAVTPRDYQMQFINMASSIPRMLLADVMGLGKTISALGTLAEPASRPAVVVCPPHLCSQWTREIKRVYPGFLTHQINGFKTYPLPDVDVLVTSYNRLAPWQDIIHTKKFRTCIMDEVHELRKTGTGKRAQAALLSANSKRCFGLSGTPIFNYGIELWSVLDAISPGCLGREEEFAAEWCVDLKVREPAVLNSYLRSRGLMLRRTPEEIGLDFGKASKYFYTLDSDLQSLSELKDVMRTLAISLLSGEIKESKGVAHEFDHKLRMATGIAKAKPVAQFVSMMCEQGEKVLLAGWHHAVYDIWLKDLAAYNPVEYSGRSSVTQKAEALKTFLEDDSCKVMIISLWSGAGIDGIQHVCRSVVMGEFDWSPHRMDQVVMRVDRDGQRLHPQAFYLSVNDGSDPFILNVLQQKRSQHEGAVEGKEAEGSIIEGTEADPMRVAEMAKAYLLSIGEKIPEPVPEEGALGEVARALRRIKVPANSEEEMQEAVMSLLPGMLPGLKVEREVRIGKRMRLDFLVTSPSGERVAIELKKNPGERSAVYRQVERYVKEAEISSLVLFAPWAGIPSFLVNGTPVIVVDFSRLSV